MNKIRISDPKKFHNIMKALSVFFDEVTFTLSNEGLKVVQLDDGHISMIELELDNYFFDEFNVDEKQVFVLNIKDLLKKPLKKIYKDENLTITLDEKAINLSLESTITRNFRQELLEYSEDETPPLPNLKFEVNTRIVYQALNRIFADLNDEDYIKIIASDESINFKSKDYNTEMKRSNINLLNLNKQYSVTSSASYSVSYLKSFINAVKPLTGIISIKYSTDHPILLETETDNYKLKYWVAPRID